MSMMSYAPQPSLRYIALSLSFDLVCGLAIFSTSSIVIPRELSLLTADAAPLMSAVSAVAAASGMLCPLVGHTVDVLGTNTP